MTKREIGFLVIGVVVALGLACGPSPEVPEVPSEPTVADIDAERMKLESDQAFLNRSEDSEQFGGFRHDRDNHRDNLLGSLEPLCFENLNLPTYLFRGFRRFRVLRQRGLECARALIRTCCS